MGDHTPEKGRKCLYAVGRSAPFRRGEHLITAGADSDEVLLIEVGLVKVVLPAGDGRESVAGLFGFGDLLGDIGVVSRQPRSAHVVALTSGRVMHVAGSIFLRLRNENDDVRELFDQTWRKRQRYADDRQLAQIRDVPTRVAMSLLRWAHDFGQQTDRGLLMRGVSQRDIAQAVTASEKTVEVALNALRAAGLLRTGRLCYLLTDPASLKQRIDWTAEKSDL